MKQVELHEYNGTDNDFRCQTENTTWFLTKCGETFKQFRQEFYKAVEFESKDYVCKPRISLENRNGGIYMNLSIRVLNKGNNFPLMEFESLTLPVLSKKYDGDLVFTNESGFTVVIKGMDFSPLQLLIDTLIG